jgi:hypothetical protein
MDNKEHGRVLSVDEVMNAYEPEVLGIAVTCEDEGTGLSESPKTGRGEGRQR